MSDVNRIRTIYKLQNPAWADKVIHDNLDIISTSVQHEDELPQMIFTKGTVTVHEYGCGKMGCVIPTFDDKKVFKITSDDSEVRFILAAMNLGEWPEGMIQYYRVVKLRGNYKQRQVYGIWREDCPDAGKLEKKKEKDYTQNEWLLLALFNAFFEYGNTVIGFVYDSVNNRQLYDYFDQVYGYYPKAQNEVNKVWKKVSLTEERPEEIDYLIYPKGKSTPKNAPIDLKVKRTAYALACCVNVAKQIENIPEYASIGHALLFYLQKSIIINDLHFGNIGEIYRKERDKKIWAITDPGIVVFLTSKFFPLFAKYDL
jgi:hypothetical protein